MGILNLGKWMGLNLKEKSDCHSYSVYVKMCEFIL